MKAFVLLFIISLVGFYPGVRAAEMGNAELGFQVASQICAECHSISPEGLSSPNSDAPKFKEIANSPGLTKLALYVWLRSPHPTMPNLALEIQDEEDLFAYILSLKDKD